MNINGLSVIETIAPARSREYWEVSMSPSDRPAWPRMNENSPIWLKPAATTRLVLAGYGKRNPLAAVISDLPTTIKTDHTMTSRQLAAR